MLEINLSDINEKSVIVLQDDVLKGYMNGTDHLSTEENEEIKGRWSLLKCFESPYYFADMIKEAYKLGANKEFIIKSIATTDLLNFVPEMKEWVKEVELLEVKLES